MATIVREGILVSKGILLRILVLNGTYGQPAFNPSNIVNPNNRKRFLPEKPSTVQSNTFSDCVPASVKNGNVACTKAIRLPASVLKGRFNVLLYVWRHSGV
jgi:hypothetical protein